MVAIITGMGPRYTQSSHPAHTVRTPWQECPQRPKPGTLGGGDVALTACFIIVLFLRNNPGLLSLLSPPPAPGTETH